MAFVNRKSDIKKGHPAQMRTPDKGNLCKGRLQQRLGIRVRIWNEIQVPRRQKALLPTGLPVSSIPKISTGMKRMPNAFIDSKNPDNAGLFPSHGIDLSSAWAIMVTKFDLSGKETTRLHGGVMHYQCLPCQRTSPYDSSVFVNYHTETQRYGDPQTLL